MAGMSFGQAMGQRLRLVNDAHALERQKINDAYDINSQNALSERIKALNSGAHGGGGDKGKGLAAAKGPTFSNLGTMTGASGALGTSGPGSSDRPEGQFETPRSIAAGVESQSLADKYTANPYDPVGRGAYPDLDPPGSRGKTLYAENAAGQVFTGMSPQYQSGVTDTTQAVKDDGMGTGYGPLPMREGGIIERVGNMLGLRKPSEAPQQNANRVADQFGGLSGEAVRSLRARPRQIEEELKKQGLRKGKTRVTDPNGSPVEDTVDAKLADGEAVLNAGAMSEPGRREIVEAWNAAGAEKLGLRNGGAQTKNGVMHAAGGGLVDLRDFDEEAAKAQIQQVANDVALGGTVMGGLGSAAGKIPNLFTGAPKVAQAAQAAAPAASSTFTGGAERLVGNPDLLQNGVRRFVTNAADKSWQAVKNNPFKATTVPVAGAAGYNAVMGDPVAQSAQTSSPELTQARINSGMSNIAIATPPTVISPEAQARFSKTREGRQEGLRDEAAFSKFFNEQGITDEMRKSGKGLRQINVPGSTDKNYRTKSGEYVAMGAPSRIAAEKAKAEDPVLKRAAAMEEMRQYALQGNENAAKMYNQMLEQDSAREVEGMRSKAAVEAAGAKSGGKGDEMEYKLLKDFASEMQFTRPTVDKDGNIGAAAAPDVQAQFNDFWRADLQNQIQKAKKAGQPLTGLDDPARVQAYIQDAKKRFDLMQSVNAASAGKNNPTQFNRGLNSAKSIDDLTVRDWWKSKRDGDTGGHTLFDAAWDNVPFTSKGGMRVEDEYGYGQTLPAHNTDLNLTLGTAQRALLEKMKAK